MYTAGIKKKKGLIVYMARGVRKSYDEKIADLDNKIAELQAEKRNLNEEKEQERKNELLKIIEKSNMSADDLRELINSNKKSK